MFHGYRKRADGLYARPVYRCGSRDGPHHFFTGPQQGRTHAHPGGTSCRECGHEQGQREGAPVALTWDFKARLIADALISVGAGSSYREAAERMRLAAYRFQRDAKGLAYASRAGETVARYLDHFADLVLAEIDHDEWPEVLVLDALPLRRREVVEGDPFSWEQEGNGAILFALGYSSPLPRRAAPWRGRAAFDMLTATAQGGLAGRLPADTLVLLGLAARRPVPPRPKRKPHLWKVAVAGGLDRWSWLDFLSSLPGTPEWVVIDGESALRYAVQLRWGDATVLYSCEGHMKRKFQARARDQDHLPGAEIWSLWPDYDRLDAEATRGPLWTRDDYRRLLDRVLAMPPGQVRNITSWIINHDATIRRQFDLRRPGYPRGTGAIEAAVKRIDEWIGDRRRSFQNVRRINLTLGLMRAQVAGHADPALYTRIIREELARTNGHPLIDWGQFHDPSGVQGLFALSQDAQGFATQQRQDYWVTAQGGTLARKVAATNAYHAAHALPLLELTNARTPSVRVAGKVVADLPLIAREWDPANDGDPRLVAAGATKSARWICFTDPEHRWEASVAQRCMRLSGCPECGRVRGVALDAKERRTDLAAIRAALGDYEGPGAADIADDTAVEQ